MLRNSTLDGGDPIGPAVRHGLLPGVGLDGRYGSAEQAEKRTQDSEQRRKQA